MYQYVGPGKSKPPLEITDELKLWLARMSVGEGGKDVSREKTLILCWAITHRWFLWPGARFYTSYLSLMRAFSQPINPRWMTGGDLARRYIGRRAASKARLKRRAKTCALTWDGIHPSVTEAVEEFACGELTMPDRIRAMGRPRLSDWASKKGMQRKYPWGIDVDGDWAFENKNLRPGVVEFVRLPATLAQLEQRVDALERCVGGIRA